MIIAFYPGAGGNRYLRSIQGLEWQTSNVSYDLLTGQDSKNRYLLKESINEYRTGNRNFVLTHCLNASHLKKLFPGYKITYIVSDLKTSLKREWYLKGHDKFVSQQTVQVLDRLEHYNAFKDKSWPTCNNYADLEMLPSYINDEVIDNYNKNTQRSGVGILKELETEILNRVNSSYETIKWHKEYYATYPVEFSDDCTVVDITKDQDNFSTVIRREFDLYHSEIFDLAWSKLHA
jgi:hypothetical protein